MDPTNNNVVNATYIFLSTGRDYREVAPVIGSYFGAALSALNVTVLVERLPDGPAETK